MRGVGRPDRAGGGGGRIIIRASTCLILTPHAPTNTHNWTHTDLGSAYGTAKSGVGISSMGTLLRAVSMGRGLVG